MTNAIKNCLDSRNTKLKKETAINCPTSNIFSSSANITKTGTTKTFVKTGKLAQDIQIVYITDNLAKLGKFVNLVNSVKHDCETFCLTLSEWERKKKLKGNLHPFTRCRHIINIPSIS